MGQPIVLTKGNNRMTVYGRSQAAVHVAEGWQPVDDSIALPASPVVPDRVVIDATNAAMKLANENGVNLASITGSGANGRITLGDVKAAIS